MDVPEEVTFTQSDVPSQPVAEPGDPELPTAEGHLPLPNPTYLRIHAACCKIACLSGIADYLEDSDSRLDEIRRLAWNGSDADVLYYALLRSTSYAPSQSP